MSRELWLLRHAKSDRDLAVDDFDRPLKKRGVHDLARLSGWLLEHHLAPDYLVCSPANRALSTLKIVQEALGLASLSIVQDKRIYQESIERIKSVLAECPPAANVVLLVGHNPELEHLLINLVGTGNLPDRDKLLPTSALVRLTLPDDWSHLEAGCATLLSITYVKELP